MQRSKAFTLIELLIVLLIIGIITSVAMLALGDLGTNRKITATAKELTIILSYAQERAILQATVVGFKTTSDGYKFYLFKTDPVKLTGKWQPITTHRLLQARTLDSALQFHQQPEDKFITFLPSGNLTPFTVYIGIRGALPSYKIIGTQNGTITLSPTQS